METVLQYLFGKKKKKKELICVILIRDLGMKTTLTSTAYKASFTIRVVLVAAINKLLFKLLGNKIKNKRQKSAFC